MMKTFGGRRYGGTRRHQSFAERHRKQRHDPTGDTFKVHRSTSAGIELPVASSTKIVNPDPLALNPARIPA